MNKGEKFAKRLARALALTAAIGLFTGTVSAETVKVSLSDSVQMALDNNRTIKESLTDVDSARWALSKANRSMGPTLTWESTANRIGGEAYEQARLTGIKYDYNYGNTGTVSMPVYNATLNAQRKAARYGLNSADLTLEQTKQSIRLTATTDYFNSLQARNLVKVREDAVATMTTHLSDVNAQLRVGTVARADVLASEVDLANAKQALTTAQNNYQVAVATLNNVIGLPTDTELQIDDELRYTKYDLALEDCTDYGLLYRADAAAAHYAVKQAEASVRAAEAGYHPTVSAAATRSIAGENAFKDDHTSSNQWAAAYLNLRAAEQNIATTETAVAQAEENYKIARVRYNAGVGTNLEVMRASDDLTTARMNYYTALYSYNTGKATLDSAMGVPVDLDAMQYRAAEEEGKRAKGAREAARLHDDALFETPKGDTVRETPGVPTSASAAQAVQHVNAAHDAYDKSMSK